MSFEQWIAELQRVLTNEPHNMTTDGAKRFIATANDGYWEGLWAQGWTPEDAAMEDGEFI